MSEDKKKKIRQVVVPLDEGESANVFVWQNFSGTLYEIELHAVNGDILHSFRRMEKPGEEYE